MQEGHYFCEFLLHVVDFCEDPADVLLLEDVVELGDAFAEDLVRLGAVDLEDADCEFLGC